MATRLRSLSLGRAEAEEMCIYTGTAQVLGRAQVDSASLEACAMVLVPDGWEATHIYKKIIWNMYRSYRIIWSCE